MDAVMSATEARARLSEIFERVADHGERIVIERHGKPVAAFIPLEDIALLSPEDEATVSAPRADLQPNEDD